MREIRTRLGRQIVLGDVDRPDLLLWPGVLFDAALHEPLAALLRERGWRVALVQPPGFGGGTLERDAFDLPDCGRAFLDVAEALGAESPVFGGTSWGGANAVHAALLEPERVRGVIALNAPFHAGDQRGFFANLHHVVRVVPPGVFALGSIQQSLGPRSRGRLGLPMARMLARSLASARPQDRSAVARVVFREREALFSKLGSVATPTLVVAGEDDALCTLRGARKAATALPNGTLVVIHGTGHLSALEAPPTVATAVDGFMQRVAG